MWPISIRNKTYITIVMITYVSAIINIAIVTVINELWGGGYGSVITPTREDST